MNGKYGFYDNYRHSRALIGYFFIVNMRTDANLRFMRRVRERERLIRKFAIVKKQFDVSFLLRISCY